MTLEQFIVVLSYTVPVLVFGGIFLALYRMSLRSHTIYTSLVNKAYKRITELEQGFIKYASACKTAAPQTGDEAGIDKVAAPEKSDGIDTTAAHDATDTTAAPQACAPELKIIRKTLRSAKYFLSLSANHFRETEEDPYSRAAVKALDEIIAVIKATDLIAETLSSEFLRDLVSYLSTRLIALQGLCARYVDNKKAKTTDKVRLADKRVEQELSSKRRIDRKAEATALLNGLNLKDGP
jgi:hypothetical protein